MRRTQVVVIGTVLLSAPHFLTAGPVAQFNLRAAVERADIVVVGQVNSVTSSGSRVVTTGREQVEGQEKRASVTVLEQLKGPTTPKEINVGYGLPNVPNGVANISLGTRLLFLKVRGARYEVADPYYPSVPAQPVAESPPEKAWERAAAAIASLVRNPSADPTDKVVALSALEGVGYPRVLDLIRPATRDANTAVRIGALVDLLEAGDGTALQEARSLLLDTGTGIPSYLLHNLTYALSTGKFVPGNVDTLEALLKTPETETRRAAAQALWRLADPAALKSLSSALTDDDRDVRYYAVRGLADLANQPDWAPSIPEFESNEDRYLGHWKGWASQH